MTDNENQGAIVDRIIERNTPTDDEREALTYLITAFRFRERSLRFPFHEADLAISRPLAEFLHCEGFRHSEVPEPSTEASDDGHLITDCEHGVNSLYDRCAPCEEVEQGEPSDAQVLAALHAFYDQDERPGYEWRTGLIESMRAALRAAGDMR